MRGLSPLRVIRRLPVTWQCGTLGGQALDNPLREQTFGPPKIQEPG
jgi:hypothetical protein